MLRKPLLLKIYDAASMQRWNDQVRFVELTELDKQAHKMIIAYVLGKYEEKRSGDFDWIKVIEGGIFELLQRIVLTDLKPPLFHKIREDKEKYAELNKWIYDSVHPVIAHIGEGFSARFKKYLFSPEYDIHRRVLNAAHFYATDWEFKIIERCNPQGFQIGEIKNDLRAKQEKYYSLDSMKSFLGNNDLRTFIDICGQLRFQIRWGNIHRVPKTSVLGHMLIVSIYAYLFSLQINASPARCINNYFTGLFHDLPEVLTRDIINPVKSSVKGLEKLIKAYEKEEMENKIYKIIPAEWHADMRTYTESEFTDLEGPGGEVLRDGDILKAIDNLAAFIEAYLAWKNGIRNEYLVGARHSIAERYKAKTIKGIDFNEIYLDFE
ncbi:MAG: HD domain-containing protein [Candidatus Omnitrophica bacterium]|nr:HD domain-containing protein [Candidatus Omnitrophota bacterium]